ncbi:hypothetical protein EMIT040CA3_10351 [Bacillus pseudomycoides]
MYIEKYNSHKFFLITKKMNVFYKNILFYVLSTTRQLNTNLFSYRYVLQACCFITHYQYFG